MGKIKVRAHTCYLSHTGYAAHARGFFRSLSKFCDLRVRNFNWDSPESIGKYINQTDLEILDQITLTISQDQRADFAIKNVSEFKEFGFLNDPNDFIADVDIVLVEPSHYYFFENYQAKTKIAYTVWESTQVSDLVLQTFDKFDSIWVVSQWHKECLIKQGISDKKIWIVPEGVDSEFNSENSYPKVDEYLDNRFKFLFFGRWDYRKSVPEIINAFLEEFDKSEPVDLVLSADNPFANDKFLSTEERLRHYNLEDPRIKIKHFPSREEYLSYIHNGHVLITCARSEGWNIPLCEAIAAGIPVTYSNWGAQLEFCNGIGCPVKIVSEVTSSEGHGNYCLPDYSDLKTVIRNIYNNYHEEKEKAIHNSKLIRDRFNWQKIGEIGFSTLQESIESNQDIGVLFYEDEYFEQNFEYLKVKKSRSLVLSSQPLEIDPDFYFYKKKTSELESDLMMAIDFAKNLDFKEIILFKYGVPLNFYLNNTTNDIISKFYEKIKQLDQVRVTLNLIDGARIDINSHKKGEYLVSFYDLDKGQMVYETKIKSNSWCAPNRKYFTNWLIIVKDLSTNEVIFQHKYDASNKRVLICLESSSLGDSIAWLPAIDEFQKKHNCSLLVSTFKNELFKKEYPKLEFIKPGSVIGNLYALYRVGWFYINDHIDYNRNPVDPKTRPMQATSFDILGLQHQQLKPKITIPDEPSRFEDPYVCIGIHATAQAKYWNNPTGWQELTDWFNSIGYKVVLISSEVGNYMGNSVPTGIIDKTGNFSISDRIIDLKYAKMFIGVGSGLSWLAWATGTPVVLISGFSKPETEFLSENVIRIFNPESCNSCFNRYRLDADDWLWCPDYKFTDRQFECGRSITAQMVISEIKKSNWIQI